MIHPPGSLKVSSAMILFSNPNRTSWRFAPHFQVHLAPSNRNNFLLQRGCIAGNRISCWKETSFIFHCILNRNTRASQQSRALAFVCAFREVPVVPWSFFIGCHALTRNSCRPNRRSIPLKNHALRYGASPSSQTPKQQPRRRHDQPRSSRHHQYQSTATRTVAESRVHSRFGPDLFVQY